MCGGNFAVWLSVVERFHVETNYIEPFDENSAEMRILKLVDAGPFVLYKYSTDKT